eukprot:1094984-Rhodomonas_salina.1
MEAELGQVRAYMDGQRIGAVDYDTEMAKVLDCPNDGSYVAMLHRARESHDYSPAAPSVPRRGAVGRTGCSDPRGVDRPDDRQADPRVLLLRRRAGHELPRPHGA